MKAEIKTQIRIQTETLKSELIESFKKIIDEKKLVWDSFYQELIITFIFDS